MSDVLGTEPVIRTPDRRLRVFVSSSLVELADERRAVSRAISALRLTPVMFEQGARPHPPRDVYRAYLAQSDVFVGLCWQRYGQPPADADAIRHRRSTGALEELRSSAGYAEGMRRDAANTVASVRTGRTCAS